LLRLAVPKRSKIILIDKIYTSWKFIDEIRCAGKGKDFLFFSSSFLRKKRREEEEITQWRYNSNFF